MLQFGQIMCVCVCLCLCLCVVICMCASVHLMGNSWCDLGKTGIFDLGQGKYLLSSQNLRKRKQKILMNPALPFKIRAGLWSSTKTWPRKSLVWVLNFISRRKIVTAVMETIAVEMKMRMKVNTDVIMLWLYYKK